MTLTTILEMICQEIEFVVAMFQFLTIVIVCATALCFGVMFAVGQGGPLQLLSHINVGSKEEAKNISRGTRASVSSQSSS